MIFRSQHRPARVGHVSSHLHFDFRSDQASTDFISFECSFVSVKSITGGSDEERPRRNEVQKVGCDDVY